jgi:uncharacterized protein (DUF1778 family)
MNESKVPTRSHHRSLDQTTMSISLDKVTLKLIQEAAAKSGRTRSNFVRWIIRRSLGKLDEFQG